MRVVIGGVVSQAFMPDATRFFLLQGVSLHRAFSTTGRQMSLLLAHCIRSGLSCSACQAHCPVHRRPGEIMGISFQLHSHLDPCSWPPWDINHQNSAHPGVSYVLGTSRVQADQVLPHSFLPCIGRRKGEMRSLRKRQRSLERGRCTRTWISRHRGFPSPCPVKRLAVGSGLSRARELVSHGGPPCRA